MTRRYLVAGAVSLGVILIFFLFLLKPKFGQIGDVRNQVQQEQGKTQGLQLTLRQLQSAEHNNTQTRRDLAKFDALLPATPNLPGLIGELQKAATLSGMDLLTIAPSPPAPLANATGVDTVSVNLQVTGGFFRLETFLTRLEDDVQRVLEVQSIAIAPVTDPATGLTSLATTLTFRMYVVHPNARVSGPAPRSTATPTVAPTASPGSTSSPSPTPTGTR